MANLLQSSQTQATTAPQYFTDYLTGLAQAGASQAGVNAQGQYDPTTGAQYVGAQPLQQQAFQMAGQNVGQFQAPITQAEQLATQAGNTSITGAAQPYLAGASQSGGLQAAVPYLNQATQSPAELAQQYMNPYINTAVQSMSDVAQRNIRNNLTPQATAAAVGSGQFGSQRGAQVQGQVTANAEQDLNTQIQQLLASGYGQALQAGTAQNANLGQLGSTAGNLGQQQANLLGQLGSTAATAATNQGQLQNTSAQNLGALGTAGQNMSLADINALSTMGGQQQTIGQNQQLFPLQNLSTLSSLLKGYSMPTTTTTTAEQSPLSAIAGLTTGAAGLFTPNAAGVTPWSGLSTALGNASNTVSSWLNPVPTPALNNGSTIDANGNYVTPSGPGGTVVNQDYPSQPSLVDQNT